MEFESVKFLCLSEGKEECELYLSTGEGVTKKELKLVGYWDNDFLASDPYCHGGLGLVRGRRYSAWCFQDPMSEDLNGLAILSPTPAALEETIKLYIRDGVPGASIGCGVPYDSRWCCVGSHSGEYDDGVFDYEKLSWTHVECKDCEEYQKVEDVFHCFRCMKMLCYQHGQYIVYVGTSRPSPEDCSHQPVCEKCLIRLVGNGSDPYLVPASTIHKLMQPRNWYQKHVDRYPIIFRKDQGDKKIRCYCGNNC